MRSQKAIVVSLVSGALLLSSGGLAGAKNQSGDFNSHRGGQGSAHRSNTAEANSNAQWSADPTRGWVRAEERSDLKKPSPASKLDSNKGKPKAKRKGY